MANDIVGIASAISTPGAIALFRAVAAHAEKLKGPAKALAISVLANLKGYSEFLEETHQKVSTFKTFANPTQPVNLVDHFVTTEFVNRGKKKFNQDALMELLSKPTRMVISATAGFGKSMVMKYVALSMFENPKGKIPIFVELRHLNRLKFPDLLAYINSSYKRISDVQIEHLQKGLQAGLFILILDGFDELNHDIRKIIESQILEIGRLYPKSSILVSGRPDDRFSSWRSFTTIKICPMSKTQVVELLHKLDYDRGTKKRFIQKINNGLYETHESFLSTPLLSILMLLTFEQNANIPDKVHLFYSKAFEVLFHQHDAMKEQYDRSRKSDLRIDEFEKVFATFCLKTYIEEKTEFTKSEILRSIRESIKYECIDINPEDFLFDIEEAVCLVMREGTSYFFIHRSFQEYFTSVFLAHCPEEVRDDFLDNVVMRHWDTVLPMLFDMAMAQIEPSWVSDRIDKYLENVGYEKSKMLPVFARFGALGFFAPKGEIQTMSLPGGPYSQFLSILRRFYPNITNTTLPLNFKVLDSFAMANWNTSTALAEQTDFGAEKVEIRNFSINDVPMEILENSNLVQIADSDHEAVLKIKKSIKTEQKAKNDFLKSLFQARIRS